MRGELFTKLKRTKYFASARKYPITVKYVYPQFY